MIFTFSEHINLNLFKKKKIGSDYAISDLTQFMSDPTETMSDLTQFMLDPTETMSDPHEPRPRWKRQTHTAFNPRDEEDEQLVIGFKDG